MALFAKRSSEHINVDNLRRTAKAKDGSAFLDSENWVKRFTDCFVCYKTDGN